MSNERKLDLSGISLIIGFIGGWMLRIYILEDSIPDVRFKYYLLAVVFTFLLIDKALVLLQKARWISRGNAILCILPLTENIFSIGLGVALGYYGAAFFKFV
ncbi:MAG: hypothetical protein C4K60_03995 [Ideonella sp. MAG2]|nr:MAG: hypothetical protein C4K60_03995 [Ideonella sp. MAG2]